MSKRGFNIFLIVLVAVVALLGGSVIALLIYLQIRGLLTPLVATLGEYFTTGARTFLIVFWAVILPVLMIAFFIILVVRRTKAFNVTSEYEQAVRLAVEAERTAYRKLHTSVPRFVALNETDRTGVSVDASGDVKDLPTLTHTFEAFAAARLGLNFDPADIREFIAGMSASHLLIIEGVSGAGKTSLAYAFGEFIGNTSTIIPVQPMWKERADLLGYYNEFTKKYNETTLIKKLYEANLSDAVYITVLDEMNLARIEYYFADFLSLMELPDPDLRYLEIVSDKWETDPQGLRDGKLKVPQNMWFLGTVNNDDSAYVISDKVYDRAMALRLSSRSSRAGKAENAEPIHIGYKRLVDLFEAAENGYVISEVGLGRVRALDEFLASKFRITFGNRIRKQMDDFVSVYVACGGDELDALDRFLAKKVLRKLEYRDASTYRNELEELDRFIETTFGRNKMPQCVDFVRAISATE